MIKAEIRDFCIRFSKQLAEGNKTTEIDLLRELKQLNGFLLKILRIKI
jgi:hypothetical protein